MLKLFQAWIAITLLGGPIAVITGPMWLVSTFATSLVMITVMLAVIIPLVETLQRKRSN
jgi:hypothetical protein